MITVIIPALNEEKTIRQVIQLAKESCQVTEIIVVDDCSIDNTVAIALTEGVRVISSTSIGKGSSMREGMMSAKNECLVFLDADIPNYNSNIIDVLARPVLNDNADFVKSYFKRQQGRVTEILVKPTLEFFFPELLTYKQPLSGMIAGKRSFFQKVEFENDYGVDIGLLIDMYKVNARISEVCIGVIENDMQPLEALGKMAKQVANAIYKRINIFNISHKAREVIIPAHNYNAVNSNTILTHGDKPPKLAVFDMDNTLIKDSFIQTAAQRFGFRSQLKDITDMDVTPFARIKEIAKLLRGRTYGEIVDVVESIPLIADAVYVMRELKIRGYICGIVSDSYNCIANHLKNILGMDFALGNELEFENSIATGEVKVPSVFLNDINSKCAHEYCKSNTLIDLAKKFNINIGDIVAIGDGANDECMLKLANVGIALNPTYPGLYRVSDYILHTNSLKPVLEILNRY